MGRRLLRGWRVIAILVTALVATLAGPTAATPGGAGTASTSSARTGLAARSGVRQVTTVTNVPYRTVRGTTLDLDVYAPSSGGPYPAVLLVHGGGWHNGDKSEFATEGQNLALAGFVAFVANYRLAPPSGTWHALAPVRDLHAAIRWIRQNAATYGADPALVGALGASAGGNLAQMVGVTGRLGLGRADAVVSWSGSTRLQLCTLGSDPARTCPTRTNYVGQDMNVDPAGWDRASPYSYVTSGDPPTYLANSTAEIVAQEEATDMASRLAAAGVPCQLHLIQGDLHARGYEDQVWDESVAFLRTYLVSASRRPSR